MRSISKLMLATLTGVCLSATAQAAVITTVTTRTDSDPLFTPLNTDLLQTQLSSSVLTVASSYEAQSSAAVLFDGYVGDSGGGDKFFASRMFDVADRLELYLDVSTNASGYDLTGISTYTQWDAARRNQKYTLDYRTVGSTAWVSLVDVNSLVGVFSNPATGVEVALTPSSGLLASGVDALRFTFLAQAGYPNEDVGGGIGFREIDVVGSPTSVIVPEPASLCFLGLPVLAILSRRRKM